MTSNIPGKPDTAGKGDPGHPAAEVGAVPSGECSGRAAAVRLRRR
jgi:hypothetical protein